MDNKLKISIEGIKSWMEKSMIPPKAQELSFQE